jgi:hypothetical protein
VDVGKHEADEGAAGISASRVGSQAAVQHTRPRERP